MNFGQDFLHSALIRDQTSVSHADILNWFSERQEAHSFKLEQIPFSELDKWAFDYRTGDLRHNSGRFFSIEGIQVRTNWGGTPEWEQPIINQPEIGFLGFITKKFEGTLHFLMQAKMEPGNINMIQLAPTLQATRSNFTQVHHGKKPPYLEYFTNLSNTTVLTDALQSEQGARFLRKRNRNIIIEVYDELPVYDDYCWMTLGQIIQTMRHDNIVNMDARTVLSCAPFGGNPVDQLEGTGVPGNTPLLLSLSDRSASKHSNEDIISWFTRQKFHYELDVESRPLAEISGWGKTEMEIRHTSGRFFSVIACRVEADCREVPSWTQPLVKPHQRGLITFIVKEFSGVLHFLVQAKVEPGNFDIVEMAPTVQCLTGSYEQVPEERRPPFVNYVLQANHKQILFDTLQSEEGGRFYREENRNMIIRAGEDFPEEIPDNYIWMTAYQLKEFIKYNNFVNVQARCLLSSLNIVG